MAQIKTAAVTVLIADDSGLIRQRLAALFTEIEGVEVVGEVENAYQAVEMVGRLNPQVAVLDIHMPGGGPTALQKIRSLNNPPLVIMLTAFPSSKTKDWCLKLGAAHYFDKALELEALVGVLRQLSRTRAPERKLDDDERKL